MEYRRTYIPGGTYFFTLVTFQRRPIFSSPDAVDTLRNAFQYMLSRMPFTIVAIVILPEHIHSIWALPQDDSDYSTRWRLIKSHFTRHWQTKGTLSVNASRREKVKALGFGLGVMMADARGGNALNPTYGIATMGTKEDKCAA